MAIRPINQKEFERLQPTRKPMDRLVLEQLEWFANETGTLLGTVFFDPAENCWGWAMLDRDEQGEFRTVRMDGRLPSAKDAGTALRTHMVKADGNGGKDPLPLAS
jgi:hypothetical protein